MSKQDTWGSYHDGACRLELWEARRHLKSAIFHMDSCTPSSETLGTMDELEELLKSMRHEMSEAA